METKHVAESFASDFIEPANTNVSPSRVFLLRMAEATCSTELCERILPLRVGECEVLIEKGYMCVYRIAAKRGEIGRISAEQIRTLLRNGHFDFADWALRSLPLTGSIEDLYLSILSRMQPGDDVSFAEIEWLEGRQGLSNYIFNEACRWNLSEGLYRRALKKMLTRPDFDPALAKWMAKVFKLAWMEGEFPELEQELSRQYYSEAGLLWLANVGYAGIPHAERLLEAHKLKEARK